MMNHDGVGDLNMHGIKVSHSAVEFDDVGLAWCVCRRIYDDI